MRFTNALLSLATFLSLGIACSTGSRKVHDPLTWDVTPNGLRWNHSKEEIADLCKSAQDEFLTLVQSHVHNPAQETFMARVVPFESFTSVFWNRVSPLIFYSSVSQSTEIRDESKKCSDSSEKLVLDIFTREDLYTFIKKAGAQKEAWPENDRMLFEEYIIEFELNGLALPSEKRAKLKALKERLIVMASDFDQTLNNWDQKLHFTKAQLEGLPANIMQGLEVSTEPGKEVILTLKYPHYFPALKYVKNAEIRKQLFTEFNKRGGEENKKRLNETIKIRSEIAQLLGYKNHAQAQLARKMAQSPEKVQKFLHDLLSRLKTPGKKDLKVLAGLKHKDTKNFKISLDPWDVSYYENQLFETRYKIDSELIKQYFPMEHVVSKMFDIYQTLFSVKFSPVLDAATWHSDVKAYDIVDTQSQQKIARFYMDMFPRDGKFGHAAAFTLVRGYEKTPKNYEKPVSAIVANFNKSQDQKPSLLTHAEVETLFHEFGHIMHQTLTKAKYGSFSGTNVKRDFVEAPSQMLENWVWREETLSMISKHHITGEKLPKKLMSRMLEAKGVDKAISVLKQVFYASIDMHYHTALAPIADTSALYHKFYEDIYMLHPLKETFPEASFGHIMGGYDAGYYGYLWSEVYAQDMFTRFDKEGLLNPKVGADYRKWILESGGEKDPMTLIVNFLGRKPSNKAFLKEIKGI